MVSSTTYYIHEGALGSTRPETTTTVQVKFNSDHIPYGSNFAMTGR